MAVWLDFDWKVEAGFFWTGRWPAGLMREIGLHKEELFQSLAPNPLEPDMLTVEREFLFENRRFWVICASDSHQSAENRLRVIYIEEL